ncbi:MAG: hypothetical protein QF464_18885, partial [Myxococcota bacterium]|nr:hypothetical protein [Myxococcota bacterium]
MSEHPARSAASRGRHRLATAAAWVALSCALTPASGLLTPDPARAKAPRDVKALRASIDSRIEQLTVDAQGLERRFGYLGSKATVTKALEVAGAPGNADALAGRLYVLWRDLEPFFERHRKGLAAHAGAIDAQGYLPSHDVRWL